MDYFAVMSTQFEPVDRNLICEVLIQAAKIPKVDAAQIAKRNEGILGDRFTAPQAQAIVTTLNNMGFSFQLMPASSLKKLPKARGVPWISTSSQGLIVPVDYHLTTVTVPWSSIFVISAGHVAEIEEKRKDIRTPYADTRGMTMPTHVEVSRSSRKVHVTEVICMTDALEFSHFRLSATEFASDRVQPPLAPAKLFLRYLELLQRLVHGATHAVVGPETHQVLSQRTGQQHTFDGEGKALAETLAFRERNRWLLQLAVIEEMKRQQDTSAP